MTTTAGNPGRTLLNLTKHTLLDVAKIKIQHSDSYEPSPKFAPEGNMFEEEPSQGPLESENNLSEPDSAVVIIPKKQKGSPFKLHNPLFENPETEIEDKRTAEELGFSETLYERVETFLDLHNVVQIMPNEESRKKNFLKVVSKNVSLESDAVSSPLYVGSPLLSKIGHSSLIARRQNSPQLSSTPRDLGSPLNLNKCLSVPLKASRFGPDCRRGSEDLENKEDNKLQIHLFKKTSEEPSTAATTRKDGRTLEIRNSLQKLRIYAKKPASPDGKITEENSPFTPSNNPQF